MAEKKTTNFNLKIDKTAHDKIKSVALRKNITFEQAVELAADALVREFDREIAEGLR